MQPQYLYSAVITKVIDGDTVDANVDLGFNISTLVRFRLYGIDTMETNDKDSIKREQGYAAKRFVIDTCLNQQVMLRTFKPDKYGRWLADVYVGNASRSINAQLVENNLAVSYFGGNKADESPLI